MGGRTCCREANTCCSRSSVETTLITHIDAMSLATGKTTRVVDVGTAPIYLPSGYLIYAHPLSGTLLAVAFDLGRVETIGKCLQPCSKA